VICRFWKICAFLPYWTRRRSYFMFCWPASLYNLANKTNMAHNFSCIFVYILYIFRATVCPSSGEITVSGRRLEFATLCRWPSGMHNACILHTRRSSTHSDTYQV